jgi:hypothetical protein
MHAAHHKIGNGNEEFKRFEETVVKRHREQMKQELAKKLEEMDRTTAQELLKTGQYVDKGCVRRKVQTSVGVVWVKVKRLKWKQRPGSIYPLFDICGVSRVSERAQEHCVQVAIGQSYETSRQTLEQLSGMEMSRMSIWKVVQSRGQQQRQKVEEQRRKVFQLGEIPSGCKPPKKTAVVQVDGTLVATREVKEIEELNGRRRMEVKVGVAFTGTERLSAQRRRTLQRIYYAEAGNSEEFGERWYTQCLRHGIAPETDVRLVGDGAGWIRTLQQAMFPGSRYTLDAYHLQRTAREVLTQRQYKQFRSLVWSNQAREALGYVKHLRPSDEEHRRALEDFAGYLERNLDGMRYDRHGPVGSGVVEKTIDIVVARRMKRRGMIWSREGANNLLALRAAFLNEQYNIRVPSP